MGINIVTMQIGNPARPQVTVMLDFVVDSGAIFSVVPDAVLRRLGINPLVEQEFQLADGSRIHRPKGTALFRNGDRAGGADVLFGEEGDAVLLGSQTLTALGLFLHPLTRELMPLPIMRK